MWQNKLFTELESVKKNNFWRAKPLFRMARTIDGFQEVMRMLNSLRPRPNRRHFADDIFKCISKNENEWISPRISLKFVPNVRNHNIPALVQKMAWRCPGDKPLSEPMMVSLPTHICVTRPQWVTIYECCDVNSHIHTYMCICENNHNLLIARFYIDLSLYAK